VNSTRHTMPWVPRAHFPLKSAWVMPSGQSAVVISLNELNDTVTFRYLRPAARPGEQRLRDREVVLDATFAVRVMKAFK